MLNKSGAKSYQMDMCTGSIFKKNADIFVASYGIKYASVII